VSRCMLGDRCLYHGGRATFARAFLRRLEGRYEIIAVCPEMLGGLPCPRPPAYRRGVLLVSEGRDVTPAFLEGRNRAMEIIGNRRPVAALLMRGSPACDPTKGVFGSFLRLRGVPCLACSRKTPCWDIDAEMMLPKLGEPINVTPRLF